MEKTFVIQDAWYWDAIYIERERDIRGAIHIYIRDDICIN